MRAGPYESTYPFTNRLRGILEDATRAARAAGRDVTTDDLIRSLAVDVDGVAAAVLRDIGIGAADLVVAPDRIRSTGDAGPSRHGPAARLVDLMEDEARRLGHSYLGTEHLLLALLRLEGSRPAVLMQRRGLSCDDARRAVVRALAGAT